jgi:PAS domain S-box-containing protein
MGVGGDITIRKQAEDQLRLTIEAAPSGMIMVNSEGQMVLVNKLTCTQFGYRRQDLLNQPVEMLIPERFRAAHPAKRAAFFSHPQQRAMGSGRELYGLRKDGSEFPVEIGLSPITTEEGSFVLASIVDITIRKQAEELSGSTLLQVIAIAANESIELEHAMQITLHMHLTPPSKVWAQHEPPLRPFCRKEAPCSQTFDG